MLDDLGTGIGGSVNTGQHQLLETIPSYRRLGFQKRKLGDVFGAIKPGHDELTDRRLDAGGVETEQPPLDQSALSMGPTSRSHIEAQAA